MDSTDARRREVSQVELERTDGKHWHFALGPVEKWIVVIVATGFIGGGLMAGRWFANKVDALDDKTQTLVTQQAVTNGSLTTITTQLTDVPQLRRDVVELKVRVDSLEEGQRELRNMRGLK